MYKLPGFGFDLGARKGIHIQPNLDQITNKVPDPNKFFFRDQDLDPPGGRMVDIWIRSKTASTQLRTKSGWGTLYNVQPPL